MISHRLTWPVTCTALGLLAVVLVVVDASSVLRVPVVLTFLLVCPGLAIVRLLRISDTATEWSVAVALSISLDGLVTLVQAYTGTWSPTGAMLVLTAITLAAVAIEVVLRVRREGVGAGQL